MRRWFGRKQHSRKPIGATSAPKSGYGVPFHIVYTRHALPDPGAMAYSYDTQALPKYSPIGNGPGNAREFMSTEPVLQPLQGVTLTAIGSPGVLTGGMYPGPLIDVTSPQPGAVQAAYAGITLNPGQYMLPG